MCTIKNVMLLGCMKGGKVFKFNMRNQLGKFRLIGCARSLRYFMVNGNASEYVLSILRIILVFSINNLSRKSMRTEIKINYVIITFMDPHL